MSAIVLGKRSNSIFFEELHHPHHSPSSPSSPFEAPAPKRIRCSSSSPTHLRFSPPRPSVLSPNLAQLRWLFPDMDQQLLERALEASGNDIDCAIKSLNDLRLESADISFAFKMGKSVTETEPTIQPPNEGAIGCNIGDAAPENTSATATLPMDGPEWVDLFVQEMMNASDVDDARARASRALEVLEKSIMAQVGSESMNTIQKENVVLKEQMEILLRENGVLKRAVAIQHERQKEHDQRSQEVQHLKQLVSQYQEQLKTLELNNYALAMHLKQAQQNNSMPGRFHPDIF